MIGDIVRADDVIANIETDKVNVEVRSPQDGKIIEIYATEGSEVNVGKPLFVLDTNVKKVDASKTESAKPVVQEVEPKASTAKKDTKETTEKKKSPSGQQPTVPTTPTMPNAAENQRSETRVKMTRMRQRIAQRLKEAQNTAAMLTTFQECDMTNLIALRNKYKVEIFLFKILIQY